MVDLDAVKIGDRLKLRDDLRVGSEYQGWSFNHSMSKWLGNVVTVKNKRHDRLSDNSLITVVYIEEDDYNHCGYTPDMFKELCEPVSLLSFILKEE